MTDLTTGLPGVTAVSIQVIAVTLGDRYATFGRPVPDGLLGCASWVGDRAGRAQHVAHAARRARSTSRTQHRDARDNRSSTTTTEDGRRERRTCRSLGTAT